MFCNFWLEFPEAEQEMSTGAGSSREKCAAISLRRRTSLVAPPGILKLRLNSGTPFPLTLSLSTFFFFFLMERQLRS